MHNGTFLRRKKNPEPNLNFKKFKSFLLVDLYYLRSTQCIHSTTALHYIPTLDKKSVSSTPLKEASSTDIES